jgi:hypothetical protein
MMLQHGHIRWGTTTNHTAGKAAYSIPSYSLSSRFVDISSDRVGEGPAWSAVSLR